MRGRYAASLVCLLLLPSLVGCLSERTTDPDAPAAGPPAFGHLQADGATVVDAAGSRSFAWEGVAEPAANVATASTAPPATFGFEVDASVGFARAQVTFDSVAPLLVMVHDEQGRKACASVVAAPAGDCTAAVHAGIDGIVRFVATVRHAPADLAPQARAEPVPFALNVTLYGPERLVRPEPAETLDARFSFDVGETGYLGYEPTVGVDAGGAIFTVQWTTVLRSADDGRTWEDVTPPTDAAVTSTQDPILFLDPWTGRVFVDHLYLGCSRLAWSDDQGGSWFVNPAACGLPANDHQKLGAGDNPQATIYDGIVYYSFMHIADLATARQDGGIWVTRSLDGGATWLPAEPAFHGSQGFNYIENGVVTADRAGTVYVPVYLVDRLTEDGTFRDGGFAVSVSNDRGATWTPQRLGDAHRPEDLDAGTAIDADNNAFIAYLDADGVHVFHSIDQGATWTGPRTVSDPSLRSFVLGDAVGGDRGHVAIAYLASPDTDRGPHQADGWARWFLYVTMTQNALDDDPTWVTAQVTPHPVNVGTICMFYVFCPGGGDRNLGDFLDIQVTPDGRVVVATVDACPDGCTTRQESTGTAGIVAVQKAGPRLFEGSAPWAQGS